LFVPVGAAYAIADKVLNDSTIRILNVVMR